MVQNQGERKLQQAAFKWSKHECTESPPLRAVIGSANGAYLGGGIRGAISWAILKSTGASAGYPDFFIHRRGHNGEIGLAIEFKVGDNDLTPDQKWWREELLAEGNEYKVVRSLAGFKKELHEYLHGPPPPPQRTVTGHDLPSASALWEYTVLVAPRAARIYSPVGSGRLGPSGPSRLRTLMRTRARLRTRARPVTHRICRSMSIERSHLACGARRGLD